jgi:hypothetical protein
MEYPMSACDRYEHEWEAWWLGSLDAAAANDVRAHLATGCALCAARSASAAHLVSLLGAGLEAEDPPAHLELQLRRRLKQEAPALRLAATAPAASTTKRRWLAFAPAAAALLLVVSGAVVLQNLALRRELLAARATPPVVAVPVAAAPSAVAPSASADPAQPASAPTAQAEPPPAVAEDVTADVAERERREWQAAVASAAVARDAARDAVVDLQRQLADARREVELARTSTATLPAPVTPAAASTGDGRVAVLQAEVTRLAADVARLDAELQRQTATGRRYAVALQTAIEPRATRLALRPVDPAAGRAVATATVTADGRLVVGARDLPALPPDKCYQLWVIRRDSPLIASAGVVEVTSRGEILHAVRVGTSGGPITGVALTDEPIGGSMESRGRKLLFGSTN